MNKFVVRCKNLKKSYDSAFERLVLRDLSLNVELGSSAAITGSSGSGKTTLLNIIAGLENPDGGEVYVADQNLAELGSSDLCRHRNQNIGVVFQFHNLLPEFNAQENIAMPMLIAGSTHDAAIDKAKLLLSKVGLGDRAKEFPSRLSGGECQRVAVARAMIMNPACLLADEPTGNLDKKNADIVCGLLVNLCTEFRTALIVTTHDSEVADYMDHKFGLIDGKLLPM